MKQMPPPGNSIGSGTGGGGGVGGVGGGSGGVFPPQLSPQQLAMLSNIYPHVQQFHLVSLAHSEHSGSPCVLIG